MLITPDIYRIGNDMVAAYLIVRPEGVTVIDAGLPGHWRDLMSGLQEVGKTPEDIRGLILTHGDSDHVGFAERLRAEVHVPVFIHRDDVDRAKGGDKPKTPGQALRLMPALQFFTYAARKGGLKTRWLTDVNELRGGEVLDLPGTPCIIPVPGHSPGSIAVHSPMADALFVGDALTTRHVLTGQVGPQSAPFTDDDALAKKSLQALIDTGATWVFPGHGAPFGQGIASAVKSATG